MDFNVNFVSSLLQKNGQETVERIKMHDAAMFPIYASMGLFGLYLFFKVLYQ